MRRFSSRLSRVLVLPTLFFFAALLLLLPGLTPAAHAQIVFNILESGGNVTATGSGSIDLTGLTSRGDATALGAVRANTAAVIIAPTTDVITTGYSELTGPTAWGPTTSAFFASSYTGANSFGLNASFGTFGPVVFVPENYVSGTPLAGTNTYTGQTFASLGLTPGTYNYTKTSNGTTAVTVNIGVVPEPGTLALLSTSLLPLGSLLIRKRRRKA